MATSAGIMEEYDFEKTLEALHQWHSEKHDTIQLYTTEVQKICTSSLLAAKIRHSPITHRIKTWDSAKGKVLQQRLKRPSLKQMKRDLHDFGGIRISVYFPGDVDKVVEILQDYLRVTTKPKKPKKETRNLHNATFGGYRATHIMVRLKESEIPQDKVAWEGVEVEIQIATLVMNVWSEIEHDMIYKPLKTLGQEISENEIRLLDLINGIVMTGEVALRQLEASTKDRLSRDANNDHTAAFDWHGLAVWIGEYHRDKFIPLGKDEWKGLKQLHGILDATGYNQHKRIYALLDGLYKDSKVTTPIGRQMLPNLLLKHFCEQDTGVINHVEPSYLSSWNPLHRVNFARDLGLQLLYSLSIAIYLGIGDRFSDTTQIKHHLEHPLPSLVDFLDLMHPTRPICDKETQVITRIADFCQVILDRHLDDPDLKICIELPRKGLIAHGVTSGGLSRIIFPSLLLRIFPLKYSHLQYHWDDLHILDYIDEHIHRNDQNTIVWEPAPSSGFDEGLEQPLDKRFFLPTQTSSSLGERWRLEDLQDELELKLVYDWKDEHRLDHLPQVFPYPDQGMTTTPCDALQLAYRMYPEDKCNTVFRAWQKAYSFLASPEGYNAPSYTELPQATSVNRVIKSESPSTIQHDKIKREASPIPAKQSHQWGKLIRDPLERPQTSHSDETSRYETFTRASSTFSEPANTSWSSGKTKTPKPGPIRADSAEPPRTPPRSVTPRLRNFSSPKNGTMVVQTIPHDTIDKAKRREQLRQKRFTTTPARSVSPSSFPQTIIGMKRGLAYDNSERIKKRKMD
ncbi:hypothetical protein F4801DRAFT_416855 [Xylaria longipes]|nr:hypothetical protein F4801DRAFT_416855 [Xylaria longipes]